MIINLVFAIFVFGSTFAVSVFKSVAHAFAFCFLPALLFFRPVTGYVLNTGFPELRISNAAVMGLMAGMVFRWGHRPKINWSLVDLIVLGASASAITTAIQTETWHTGYSELLQQLLGWLVPYFVARYSFQDVNFRQNCLRVLIPTMLVLSFFAAIEFRLSPHAYEVRLASTGLQLKFDSTAMMRESFFRSEVSFIHPIFFGDGCVSLFCVILMLGAMSKGGWTRPMVLLAAAAAACSLVTSISFGPYLGMTLAFLIFCFLRLVPFAKWYVFFVGIVLFVVAMCYATNYLATTPMPERVKDKSIRDSFWVRRLIVQNSWPMATTSGPFGSGKPKLDELDARGRRILDLDSVDNAYMLFLIVRGYVYTGLWALIPICVSWRVSAALRRNRRKDMIFPLAIGTASSIGLSFAFYFVWAGWNPEPYTIMWLVATAFTMGACDVCFARAKADELALAAARQPIGQAFAQFPGRTYQFPTPARSMQ